MGELSSDCSDLAATIFDQAGMINKKWYKNALQGPASWLRDECSSDFLVIESAQVETDYRRKGIATLLVYSILKQAQKRGVEFAFVWPDRVRP
jgi:N-acetylglutamate synthase-like GNAT family acetyltransferase